MVDKFKMVPINAPAVVTAEFLWQQYAPCPQRHGAKNLQRQKIEFSLGEQSVDPESIVENENEAPEEDDEQTVVDGCWRETGVEMSYEVVILKA